MQQQQQHNVYVNTAPHHQVHLQQGYTGRVVTTGASQPAAMSCSVCMLMFGFFLIIPGGVMTSLAWSSTMVGMGIACLSISMILLVVGFVTCCCFRNQQQNMARPATAIVTTSAVNVMQNNGNVPQYNSNAVNAQQSFTQPNLPTNIHATTTILQHQTQPGFQQPNQQGYQPHFNQDNFSGETHISPSYHELRVDTQGFQAPLAPPSYQDATAGNK